jgi:hypothetical protein
MKRVLHGILADVWWLLKWVMGILGGILLYAWIATLVVDSGQRRARWDSDPCPNGCTGPD